MNLYVLDDESVSISTNLVLIERSIEKKYEPEKKIPSTAANAIRRSPKVERSSEIHLRAQSAFFLMQGTKKVGTKEKK